MSKRTVKSLPTSCTAVVDGVRIHGEIISWDVAAKTRITHTRMIDALAAAGLDTDVSRPMAARNAFARACRHLQEARIIRRIDDSALTMRFQFTAARAELRRKIEEMNRPVNVPEPVKATPAVAYSDVVARVEELEASKAASA